MNKVATVGLINMWRSIDEAYEWSWGNSGQSVELLLQDDGVVHGRLEVDAWFDGEDEIPVFTVRTKAGVGCSVFDAKGWRFI